MKATNGLYVWSYTFIDDQSFCQKPSFDDEQYGITPKKLEMAKQAFKECGWEGDGEVQIIWIPQFLFSDDDCYGLFVWHVKQRNNGFSFIASEINLTEMFPQAMFHE